jgi:predicted Zn-dependent protease
VKKLIIGAMAMALGCGAIDKVKGGDVKSLNNDDLQQAKDTGAKAQKVVKGISSLNDEMTAEQEYWVGRSIATNILAKSEYKYEDKDAIAAGKLEKITAYVNNVGSLLAFAAMNVDLGKVRPTQIQGWHFVVIDSPTVNAMAAPGGFVFITTAAIKLAKSEDELACVLAHEIAHVMKGHALGNIQQSRYASVGSDALQAAGTAALSPEQMKQLTELMGGMIDDTMNALFVKGYSRDTEFEADALGVKIASAAGYDPTGMTRFLTALSKVQDTGNGGFTATHPAAADRIAKVNDAVKGMPAVKVPGKRVDRFATAAGAIK